MDDEVADLLGLERNIEVTGPDSSSEEGGEEEDEQDLEFSAETSHQGGEDEGEDEVQDGYEEGEGDEEGENFEGNGLEGDRGEIHGSDGEEEEAEDGSVRTENEAELEGEEQKHEEKEEGSAIKAERLRAMLLAQKHSAQREGDGGSNSIPEESAGWQVANDQGKPLEREFSTSAGEVVVRLLSRESDSGENEFSVQKQQHGELRLLLEPTSLNDALSAYRREVHALEQENVVPRPLKRAAENDTDDSSDAAKSSKRARGGGGDGRELTTSAQAGGDSEPENGLAKQIIRDGAKRTLEEISELRRVEGTNLLHRIADMYGLRVQVIDSTEER